MPDGIRVTADLDTEFPVRLLLRNHDAELSARGRIKTCAVPTRASGINRQFAGFKWRIAGDQSGEFERGWMRTNLLGCSASELLDREGGEHAGERLVSLQ